MKDPEQDKISDKTGFNFLVGCIAAVGIAGILYGIFGVRFATPVLTIGLIAIVIAALLAMLRQERK